MRSARVGFARGGFVPADLRALLGAEPELLEGQISACDVRLVSPGELAEGGPRILRRHRLRAPHVPAVVVVGADASASDVRRCFREGAADVVRSDEIATELEAALDRAILQEAARRSVATEEATMAAELGKRARELESTLYALRHSYDATLTALVSALDLREKETACHSQRVAAYALMLALRAGVDESELEDLYRGALLHDIGKIGIPDAILLKPGSFDEAQWEIMRTHPALGGEILEGISFLRTARDIPLYHHEAWDGRGYPTGLAGTDIPLSPRIFAVIDSYDAIRSRRPYKTPQPHEAALEMLRTAAGRRLDPSLVELFCAEPQQSWLTLQLAVAERPTFHATLDACRRVMRS
jgi:response regulator RpfG family c-di-GMP phosphodiesterase